MPDLFGCKSASTRRIDAEYDSLYIVVIFQFAQVTDHFSTYNTLFGGGRTAVISDFSGCIVNSYDVTALIFRHILLYIDHVVQS